MSGPTAAAASDSSSGYTLYEVLGVPRTATTADIKRAYRRKSLQSHPDKNPSAAAAAHFIELTRAYRVLANPSHRRLYDIAGDRFFARLSLADQPHNTHSLSFLSVEAYLTVMMDKLSSLFSSYRSGGSGPQPPPQKPTEDAGGDWIPIVRAPDFVVKLPATLEELYTGAHRSFVVKRKRFKDPLSATANAERIEERVQLRVRIERGMLHGQRIVLRNQADQLLVPAVFVQRAGTEQRSSTESTTPTGGASPSSVQQRMVVVTGNVVFVIAQQPHEVFRRAKYSARHQSSSTSASDSPPTSATDQQQAIDNDDDDDDPQHLHMTYAVSVMRVLSGLRVRIDRHLDGKPRVYSVIPQNDGRDLPMYLQRDAVLRVAGQGMPLPLPLPLPLPSTASKRFGDLFIHLDVHFPVTRPWSEHTNQEIRRLLAAAEQQRERNTTAAAADDAERLLQRLLRLSRSKLAATAPESIPSTATDASAEAATATATNLESEEPESTNQQSSDSKYGSDSEALQFEDITPVQSADSRPTDIPTAVTLDLEELDVATWRVLIARRKSKQSGYAQQKNDRHNQWKFDFGYASDSSSSSSGSSVAMYNSDGEHSSVGSDDFF